MKESKNLRLRALKEKDIWTLHAWVNDPEIVQFTNFFHPVSEMEQKEWFANAHRQTGHFLLAIELKEGNRLIGTCGLNDINPICRKAELYIKISDREMWGRGLGSEAIEILTDFGVSDLNLRRIWLRVMADNERAINLYKKSGFLVEGVLRQDYYIRGEYKDMMIMAKIFE